MVELLRVSDKGLGLLYKGALLGSVNSAFDHSDAWFVLEQVAEKLAQAEGVRFKNCHLCEKELGDNWQWSDAIKLFMESKASKLDMSIKHITKEDVAKLDKVSLEKPDWVTASNAGFLINQKGIKELACSGSAALVFVLDYVLMAGYSSLFLGFDSPLMADFDVY